MLTPVDMITTTKWMRRRIARTGIGIVGATLMLSACGGDSSTKPPGTTLSSDATLSALVLNSGALTPAFASGTTAYTAAVSSGTPFQIVTPTTTNAGAKVTVNGTPVTSGSASGGIALVPGANTVTVVVTAQDLQTTRVYTIVVARATSA